MNNLLTVKYLTDRKACKEGIAFAKRNNLIGLPIDWLLENAQGDFNIFKYWLQEQQNTKITYDKQGNIFTQTHPYGSAITYTYNEHGNMLTKTLPSGSVYTYTYDEHGNMLTETHPSGDVITYTYDKHGNMLTETYPSGNVYTYTYEHWPNGQLKRANDLFIPLYEELKNV